MGLSGPCVSTVCLLACSIVLCVQENKVTNGNQALKFLKYLNGYVGQDYLLQLPVLILSPVIIIPIKNDELDLKDDGKSDNKNDETISNMKREVISVELVDNPKSMEENDDIEVNFRQALNRGKVNKEYLKINHESNEIPGDELSADKESKDNVTKEDNVIFSSITTTEETKSDETTTEIQSNTTSSSTETEVTDSMVSNSNNISEMLEVPQDIDERWRNFTLNANNTIFENKTEPYRNNSIELPSEKETSTMKGPYSAALYNNAFIDQLSITTNSYTNEESPLPPPQDDRWRSFSSLEEMLSMPSGFRPLAGLYYDGFLHKPLIKIPGFVPYKKFYLV